MAFLLALTRYRVSFFFFSLWYFANYARYILVPYLGATTLNI